MNNIIKDLAKKTMTEEKKKEAKNDWFAYYVTRPISYFFTIPFLKTNIKPNTISLISFFPPIIGFLLISFGENLQLKLLGWLMFLLWNILDGVDGNIARYKNQLSKTGSLWDATSGYIAMVLSYFAMGIGCYYGNFAFLDIDNVIIIILGGLSSIFVIFPRLVMHKRISSVGNDQKTEEVKNKSNFGFLKIIALNLVSIAGFVQVFMLVAICTKTMDIFTISYFIINSLVLLVSLKNLLKY